MSSAPEVSGDSPSAAKVSSESIPLVREHSFLTIILVLAASAAALAGIEWGLSEERDVVQAWGDTLAGNEWVFPSDGYASAPDGVSYTFAVTQPGPLLTTEIDASLVEHVFVDVSVERALDGVSVPYQLEWYWATPENVAANAAWPFAPNQAVSFYRPVRHRPNEHVADVGHHGRWAGTVAKAVITVRLWTNDPGPFRATFRRVELVG